MAIVEMRGRHIDNPYLKQNDSSRGYAPLRPYKPIDGFVDPEDCVKINGSICIPSDVYGPSANSLNLHPKEVPIQGKELPPRRKITSMNEVFLLADVWTALKHIHPLAEPIADGGFADYAAALIPPTPITDAQAKKITLDRTAEQLNLTAIREKEIIKEEAYELLVEGVEVLLDKALKDRVVKSYDDGYI